MAYVDGFVIAVPKDRLEDYKEMARVLAPIWKDMARWIMWNAWATTCRMASSHPFPAPCWPRMTKSWCFPGSFTRQSEARDAANKSSIEDPRVKQFEKGIPFDGKRMIFGGFTPFLGLGN